MSGLTLLIIAYVSLIVFAATVLVRTAKMARMPMHLRWELAPVPHEKGKSHYGGSYFEEYEWWTKPREKSLVSELIYMFKEIVFLKGVWENNRSLWWFSFPFHTGLYLLIVSGVLLLMGTILQLLGVTNSGTGGLLTAVVAVAVAGFLLGAIGAGGLLVLRTVDPRLKPFRTPAALFNLVFLLAVFLTGGAALVARSDLPQKLAEFTRALLTADSSVEVPTLLGSHFVLVFLFMAYLPFTQMLHFVAKYFTYHRVRWDDRAMSPNSAMEEEVKELLGQPVTWSGAHLKADGSKNWVDIVTGDKDE